VNKGERAAFPQARVVALAECGTHAIFDAVVGAYTTGENTLAQELVSRLEPGMLVLADRGFCGFPLWSRAVTTGADLLWRAKSTMAPRHVETLDDGSWLAELRPSGNAGWHAEPLIIRVIDYELDDGRGGPLGPYRLITTLLVPAKRPRQSWRSRTRTAGRSRARSRSSSPTSAARTRCCDRSPRRWSPRRSGGICAATTPSAP
jgi:hypothetical protein